LALFPFVHYIKTPVVGQDRKRKIELMAVLVQLRLHLLLLILPAFDRSLYAAQGLGLSRRRSGMEMKVHAGSEIADWVKMCSCEQAILERGILKS
jgi:hypothetical protein